MFQAAAAYSICCSAGHCADICLTQPCNSSNIVLPPPSPTLCRAGADSAGERGIGGHILEAGAGGWLSAAEGPGAGHDAPAEAQRNSADPRSWCRELVTMPAAGGVRLRLRGRFALHHFRLSRIALGPHSVAESLLSGDVTPAKSDAPAAPSRVSFYSVAGFEIVAFHTVFTPQSNCVSAHL